MLSYPIKLEEDDGTMMATSPDFPELTTFGDDRDEAIARAVGALGEAIAARIHDGRDIPPPSKGNTRATLPTLTAIKVTLYRDRRIQEEAPAKERALSALKEFGERRAAPDNERGDGSRTQ